MAKKPVLVVMAAGIFVLMFAYSCRYITKLRFKSTCDTFIC